MERICATINAAQRKDDHAWFGQSGKVAQVREGQYMRPQEELLREDTRRHPAEIRLPRIAQQEGVAAHVEDQP